MHSISIITPSAPPQITRDPRGWGPLLQKKNKEELSAYRVSSRLGLLEHIQLILELLTQENVTEVHEILWQHYSEQAPRAAGCLAEQLSVPAGRGSDCFLLLLGRCQSSGSRVRGFENAKAPGKN